MNLSFRLSILVLLLTTAQPLLAQPAQALELYQSSVGEQQLLLNGRQYGHRYPQAAGNPFFKDKMIWEGSLEYNGVNFQGLKLGYDVYNKHILINLPAQTQAPFLILHPGKVQAFQLGKARFIHIKAGQYENLPGGLYQQLSPMVVVKREKALTNALDSYTKKQFAFENRDQYLLLFEGRAIEIRNKQDTKAVTGNSPKWKEYTRINKLRFKRKQPAFEEELVQLGRFLSQD